MKQAFLVGESLPRKQATPCANQTAELAAIDSRHGVFPNLVGKPLLSALHWLHANGRSCAGLLDQLDLLMTDKARERRFNVFQKKTSKEDFKAEAKLSKRLSSFDPTQEVWLTFGVQTNFGLLGFLTGRFKRTQSYSKKEILEFSIEFLRLALTYRPLPPDLSSSVPSQRTARLGVFHRLCCHKSRNGDHLTAMLRLAVKNVPTQVGGKPAERSDEAVTAIVAKLHGLVPLLHNEAYQDRYEIGYNQAHFVLGTSVRRWKGARPDEYWSVMGEAIGRRLQGQFVEK